MKGYIGYARARADQLARLAVAIPHCAEQIEVWRAGGGLRGPGPVFVAIGNSLAAAGAAVWTLRARGIEAWRAGAGDQPAPFPPSPHPVIAVSQSGRSTETLAVLSSMERHNRYAVVNVADSPIAATASRFLHLGDIPDSYASTTGYTATAAALGLLADAWDAGRIDPGWAALPARARALEDYLTTRMPGLITGDAPYADVVAAAPGRGSAEYGALLLREVARIPSTPMSTREYLHGAMESAGAGLHLLLGDGRELTMARALAEHGQRVVLVTSATVADARNLSTIAVPDVPAGQRAVLDALVLQSLAGELAERRHLDIEQFVFHHTDTKVGSGGG